MGSPIYDFLTESLLFDDSLIEENFESASDGELRSELQNYREFCLTSLSELETEATADSNSLHVFAGVDGPDLSLLKRGALYFNRFIVSDPLFPLTRESTEADRATNKAMGLRAGDLDRRRLTVVVRELKTLTPMVAANYVKILPASFALEPPPVIPYRFSRTGFSDVLPPQLLELLQRDAIVQSGRKTEDGWAFDGTTFPARVIQVGFKSHPFNSYGYSLMKSRTLAVDEGSRTATSYHWMPDGPPSESDFESWVKQSINQSAEQLADKAAVEAGIAARCRALYISQSNLVSELLRVSLSEGSEGPDGTRPVPVHTARSLFDLDLPILDRISIDALMRVRQDEGEAFAVFRVELEKQMREVRTAATAEEARIKAENAVHELCEVQPLVLAGKLKELRTKLAKDAVLTAFGLGMAVQSSGWGLLVAASAAFQGFGSIAEYRAAVTQNPAYFLLRASRLKPNRR